MGVMIMHVRAATIKDAEGIAHVHVDTWRTTYLNIMSPAYLATLTYDIRKKLWQKHLSDKEKHIFVLENEQTEIVGFAACNQRPLEPHVGDLTSIYIIKEEQQKGYGRLLMKALFQTFNELGCEKVFVEVLVENDTRHLYEYFGAKIVEIDTMNLGTQELEFFIYKWDSVKNVLAQLA